MLVVEGPRPRDGVGDRPADHALAVERQIRAESVEPVVHINEEPSGPSAGKVLQPHAEVVADAQAGAPATAPASQP